MRRRRKPAKARQTKAKRGATAAPNRRPSALGKGTGIPRLARERDDAVEQLSATSEVLKLISSSPGDLQAVFAAILAHAVRICDAKFGMLMLHHASENSFDARAMVGAPPALITGMLRKPFKPQPGVPLYRMTRTKKTVHTRDAAAEHVKPRSAELAGARTHVIVPMLKRNELVGAISIFRQEVRPFTKKQIELVSNFARQAVIAIENARLLNELRQRTDDLTESLEQQTATSEVLRVISSSPTNVQPVLGTIVRTAVSLCNSYDAVILLREGEHLRIAAHHGPMALDFEWLPLGRDFVSGRTVIDGVPVHVPDFMAAGAEFPRGREVAKRLKQRTVLGLPLKREGQTIGCLFLRRTEVLPFTDKQIELLTTFADQAVIAIENVRLFEAEQQRTRELSESLEQQTATAEVLGVISSSPGELRPVFDAMLANAVRICEAKFGNLALFDGNDLRIAAMHNPPPAFEELRRGEPVVDLDLSIGGFVVRTKQLNHVNDLAAQEPYARSPLAKLAGARTSLAVPMLREGTLVGVIAIYRQEVRPFTDKQIALVQNFAAQAVIAIENARLLNELRESLDQQTAISEVLEVISSSPGELDSVFHAMVEKAARLCETDSAWLILRQGGALRFVARHNAPAAVAEQTERYPIFLPGPASGVGRSITTKQVVQVPDLVNDQAYINRQPNRVALVKAGYRSQLSVPLIKNSEAIGAFNILRRETGLFTENQIELVSNFAKQAVIAIENTRLLNELRQRTDNLTESLEQQTATSDILRVISSSRTDLQPVFDTIVANAVRLCGAHMGAVFRFDGKLIHLVAHHNYTLEVLEVLHRTHPRPPQPDQVSGRAILTRAVVQVEDTLADPNYLHEMAHAGNWRSILGMPMLHADVPIGVIVITRNERGPFSVGHINLLKSFADQAVIAIENTRLFEEVQTRTREVQESLEYQTAISEVLNVISRSPNELQPVLDTIVETAARLCEAEYSVFFMRQDEGDYRIAATNNAEAEFIKFARDHPFEPTRASCTGRAVIERRTVHVVDAATDPEYDMPDYQRVANNRTMLGVPLLRGDVVIGVIVMVRTVVKPFTEKQIDLVTTFADQALIAIENVRLFEAEQQRTRELRESLEQQTATSDVLRVISSAPGDLSPVFAAILENATHICQAAFGILQLYEDGAFRLAATHNTPPDYSEARRREPIVHPGPQTPLARVAATKQFVHIYDYAEERAYKQRDPGVVRLVELGGARTHVVVPMLKEDELIGTISIYRQEVRPFTNKQIELVTNFANQAVIAIENARLLDELRQRTDALGRSVGELRALGDVSQAVNSTLDLETVLSTIVAKSVELSGTEAGAIYGYDHEAREFRLRATYGMDQELIGALTQRHIGLDQQDVAQAFAQREPIQIADLKDETRSEVNDIIVRAGFRARLLAPLLRGEEIVGMLVVRRKAPGLFAQNTVDLIKTFAAQSALAIQNARLFDNVETRTRELARSLNDLRTAQDRLVQTQKLASLGQLTAGIAHEIKNPLNFVNNFSGVSVELIDELEETLGRVTVDDKTRAEITELADTLRDNLDKIVQHGKRADSIVKNMLLHSREGSGERRLVDVNALVEESLNLAYHGARAEKQGFNVTLERSFDPSAGEVDAFPQEISRVLLNLISNGFYAATKRQGQESGNGFEPTIRAVTKSLGDRVEIRIRDNGTGISREVREKMFNPFFTTKPAGEGTGLGLSISHDIIVKQHSGIIEVDTEAGAFTEFRIILPRTAT